MNREPHDERMEREWALQERAARAERLGLDESSDPALQRYRTVMRALRQPLDENLPADFASTVAMEARRRAAGDTRLELYLSWALLGVLVGMLIGVAVRYASSWKPLLPLALSQPWLLALAGVLVLLASSKLLSVPHRPSDESPRRLG
jgi:anti-sigma factor RsiW